MRGPILRSLGLGVRLGLVLLVAGLALVLVVVPKATGSTPLTVLTGSMAPHLAPGTIVVVRPASVESIRLGDVATYQIASGRPEVVTHRVVGITTTSKGERLFTFRGDANALADSTPVTPAQIRGVVWYSIPLAGYVDQAVNGPWRSWLVPLLAALLFGFAGVMIGLGVRDAVRRRANSPAGRRGRHVQSLE